MSKTQMNTKVAPATKAHVTHAQAPLPSIPLADGTRPANDTQRRMLRTMMERNADRRFGGK